MSGWINWIKNSFKHKLLGTYKKSYEMACHMGTIALLLPSTRNTYTIYVKSYQQLVFIFTLP